MINIITGQLYLLNKMPHANYSSYTSQLTMSKYKQNVLNSKPRKGWGRIR